VPKAVDADDSDELQSGSDDSSDGARRCACSCRALNLITTPAGADDEDDTAALLAELEKIKAGRAEEAARRETSRAAAEFAERAAELAGGNPLLHLQGGEADFGLKRAWHDDSVFKHQSRNEPVAKKRFINDTIRSDFHRRFLQRYIR
jgi:protein CWC15